MRGWLLCIVLVLSQNVRGDSFAPATNDYDEDLGQLYGIILAVKYYKEICNESFPELSQSNEDAYQKWRNLYFPLIQEIENHYDKSIARLAKRYPSQYKKDLNDLEASFVKGKESMRKKFSSNGPDGLQRTCRAYPIFLTIEKANLEHCCAEQFSSIRRGSGGE